VNRITRILLNALTCLSLLFCAVFYVIWVPGTTYCFSHAVSAGTRWEMWIGTTSVEVERHEGWQGKTSGGWVRGGPLANWVFDGFRGDWKRESRFLGIRWEQGMHHAYPNAEVDWRPRSTWNALGPFAYWQLHVPYGISLFFALSLPVLRVAGWIYRRRKRTAALAANRCPICDYDLRATPDRCPECGTPVRSSAVVSGGSATEEQTPAPPETR
jgi:hypothetical protein